MDARKLIGFAIGPVVSGGLGVITLPVMAWTFSPADIGRLSMLQLLISLGVIVFSLGMDQAYVREYHEVNDDARKKLLISAVLPGFFVFIVLASLIAVFSPTLPALFAFHVSSGAWSIGLLLAIAVALISRFLSLVLRMREQGLAFSLSQSLPKLLFLLVVLFAWVFDSPSFDLLLSANVATLAIVLIAYAYLTRAAWIPEAGGLFDLSAMRRMMRFGWPLVFGGVASWAVMTIDKALLQRLSTLDELGIYAIAASIASAVGLATVIFTTVWVPTVYKWHAEGDAWPRVQAASQYAMAGCCLAISVAGVLSPLAALILPARYASVPLLIPACMTLPLFYALSEATAVGLGLERKSIYSMFASFLGAAVSLTAGLWLVPALGARGAAVTAVVAATVFVIARTEFAHRVWHPMARKPIFAPVMGFSVVTCLYAISDQNTVRYWSLAWGGILLCSAWFYRQKLQFFATQIIGLFRKWKRI